MSSLRATAHALQNSARDSATRSTTSAEIGAKNFAAVALDANFVRTVECDDDQQKGAGAEYGNNGSGGGGGGGDRDALIVAHIHAHPLFPVLKLLAHKCDLALGLRHDGLGLSSQDEIFKIDDVIQLLISLRDSGEWAKGAVGVGGGGEGGDYHSLSGAVGTIICEAIFNLRTQLHELAKVWEFAARFCDKYIEFLKCSKPLTTVMPSAATTAAGGQQDGSECSSSANSTGTTIAHDNSDEYGKEEEEEEEDYGYTANGYRNHRQQEERTIAQITGTVIPKKEIRFEIKTECEATVTQKSATVGCEMPNANKFNVLPLLMASNSLLLLAQQHQHHLQLQSQHQQQLQLQLQLEQHQRKEEEEQQKQVQLKEKRYHQQQQPPQRQEHQQPQQQQPHAEQRQQQLQQQQKHESSKSQPTTVAKKRRLPFSAENLIVAPANTVGRLPAENGENSKRKKSCEMSDTVVGNDDRQISSPL